MTDNKTVMQQALDALECCSFSGFCDAVHHDKNDRHDMLTECPVYQRHKEAIFDLQAAIAQPVHQNNALVDAIDAVLSNQEHAFSGGMCSYQKGSQTWQIYEDLRIAQYNIAQPKAKP